MKLAILGLGSIGQRHVRNLIEMGETDLLGCDVRVGQEEYTTGLSIQCVSDAAMVWEWKPEAVLICTPPSKHFRLMDMARFKGVHVFCEKPLCINYLDAKNTAERARGQIVLAVGYQLRFTDASHAMKVRDWDNDIRIFSKQNMAAWPSQYEKCALEEFSHDINLATYWNGPVKEVVAIQSGSVWKIDLVHALARSYVKIDSASQEFKRYASSDSGDWVFDQPTNDTAYKLELAAFLKACRGEEWDERLCGGAEAAHTVRIIEACRASAREFKVVTLA